MNKRFGPDRSAARADADRIADTVAAYDVQAPALARGYEALAFEQVHAAVLDLIPQEPASVLDVGAGSGRDAAWFAGRGHQVVAVEPSAAMRAAAAARHRDASIRWLADRLPALDAVLRAGTSFDLVWLSAVWMHVPAGARERALRKLVTVLRPGGSIMITLRRGPASADRPMDEITAGEVESLARRHGLQTRCHVHGADAAGRAGVSWETLWLTLPDDGTGALPLLRHIVLRDQKASTYKLALLRVLVRIADGAAGFARRDADDEGVHLPLGLVALYWVRMFRPLIEAGLPQHPRGNAHLAFLKAGFQGLAGISSFRLRVGQRFTGADAHHLILAMRDAARCIRNMPARYTTYPGKDEPVFPCSAGRPVQLSDEVVMDEAFLWRFGALRVPAHIWHAMGRFAVWTEPAIVNEWMQMMRSYAGAGAASRDVHAQALTWLDPAHATGDVRARALQLAGTRALHCVWSGQRLDRTFHVDHCLPFAAWPCNDLWNLLPAKPAINTRKGDRLPSASGLMAARERIVQWWHDAYLDEPALAAQFAREARGALPAVDAADGADPEAVFDALLLQRAVLWRDQRLGEWSP